MHFWIHADSLSICTTLHIDQINVGSLGILNLWGTAEGVINISVLTLACGKTNTKSINVCANCWQWQRWKLIWLSAKIYLVNMFISNQQFNITMPPSSPPPHINVIFTFWPHQWGYTCASWTIPLTSTFLPWGHFLLEPLSNILNTLLFNSLCLALMNSALSG